MDEGGAGSPTWETSTARRTSIFSRETDGLAGARADLESYVSEMSMSVCPYVQKGWIEWFRHSKLRQVVGELFLFLTVLSANSFNQQAAAGVID